MAFKDSARTLRRVQRRRYRHASTKLSLLYVPQENSNNGLGCID